MPRNPYYAGPPSDHFDGLRFFNPGQASTDRGLGDLLRWRLGKRAAPWPRSVPVTPTRPAQSSQALVVTMVGHATVLIQAAGCNILTDPVWSDRASPVAFAGPRRVTAPGVAFEDLPRIDAVLVSHCHYDHLDLGTLARLHARDRPLMVMPLGNDAIVRAHIPDARLATGDWWDAITLAPGIATTLTPAVHWSNRSLADRRMALWSGHFLATPAGTVWFAGDTGFGDGAIFARIAHLGSPDLALLPIGAYAPRWFMAAQHVDPAEAVRIFQIVGARRALGIHWGTFRLTDEPRDEPVLRLGEALAAAGVDPARFVAARPGEVFTDSQGSVDEFEMSGIGQLRTSVFRHPGLDPGSRFSLKRRLDQGSGTPGQARGDE
ncbi:membrane protein [Sphingobium sp. TA15]|uniref:Beta-lactamase-like protein n=1 Tax=Sphingobium indicum (strain DSM 16413 / CCM 7287 / MTCC 6362 / UT26 / NBRC 101211 / UT26S) TaxID=452662 RepID=D4Z8A6_SPHIU|nr:MBL fold metallo-hydrolase [Sphingobium indicum]BAI98725.1 beta-lactamase-like protein [Sphingobium indicum UT26S]BDD68775.1 membrane protein [Sphingobium sp. TA15]